MKHLIKINVLVIFCLLAGICHGQQKTPGILDKDKFSYTGFINKKIPVQLDLTILGDNTVFGEIKYLNTKNPIPIKIIGTFNIEQEYVYTLAEYEKNGNMSGIIKAKLTDHEQKLVGEWGSTKSDLSYPMNLTFKAHTTLKPNVLATAGFEGDYEYHLGETGFDGVIKITKEKNGTYAYAIARVTGGETKDVASASGTGMLIKNNESIIEVNKTCKFKITFYNGFLRIFTMYEETDKCGFTGPNASLQGAYLKIKH
ncbi:hypothetical protein [Pedobacter nototheniae]|uniref:hypothetical protein n=1 Tax=Pedobacter nototheniae TaxID=2488994 RepID=UPI002930AF42|nr:hypothetical protein [Pedobacter nototheniae]